MEEMGKHEHGKKVLGHIGSMHGVADKLNEEVGHAHAHLGEHEKRALEGKKHQHL